MPRYSIHNYILLLFNMNLVFACGYVCKISCKEHLRLSRSITGIWPVITVYTLKPLVMEGKLAIGIIILQVYTSMYTIRWMWLSINHNGFKAVKYFKHLLEFAFCISILSLIPKRDEALHNYRNHGFCTFSIDLNDLMKDINTPLLNVYT